MDERKADTRRKIASEGSIVKARLAGEEPAVILGALLAAADTLAGPNADAARERLRQKGKLAFAEGTANV